MTHIIAADVELGRDVRVADFVNLYGCTIGDGCVIGAFVEVQAGAVIGRRCKISSHTFVCAGTVIEDEVFVGHGVMFCNDRYPAATNEDGSLKGVADWVCEPVYVGRRAAIGSGAVLLPGVRIFPGATVGAGAVVISNVTYGAVVVGNPARELPR